MKNAFLRSTFLATITLASVIAVADDGARPTSATCADQYNHAGGVDMPAVTKTLQLDLQPDGTYKGTLFETYVPAPQDHYSTPETNKPTSEGVFTLVSQSDAQLILSQNSTGVDGWGHNFPITRTVTLDYAKKTLSDDAVDHLSLLGEINFSGQGAPQGERYSYINCQVK